jgi:hypothetical protein
VLPVQCSVKRVQVVTCSPWRETRTRLRTQTANGNGRKRQGRESKNKKKRNETGALAVETELRQGGFRHAATSDTGTQYEYYEYYEYWHSAGAGTRAGTKPGDEDGALRMR